MLGIENADSSISVAVLVPSKTPPPPGNIILGPGNLPADNSCIFSKPSGRPPACLEGRFLRMDVASISTGLCVSDVLPLMDQVMCVCTYLQAQVTTPCIILQSQTLG